MQIIPSILVTTEDEYKAQVQELNNSESLEEGWVQIDFMDNIFVQNQSITPDVVKKYPLHLNKEAHLMVVDPYNWVCDLEETDIKRFIAPLEIEEEFLKKFIEHTTTLEGREVGLALNVETPISILEERGYLDFAKIILLMSVKPGFQGQEFMRETIEKIKQLHALRAEKGLNFLIEVDGGINDSIVRELVDIGVDNLVIGSFLWKGGTLDENLEKIWERVNS